MAMAKGFVNDTNVLLLPWTQNVDVLPPEPLSYLFDY